MIRFLSAYLQLRWRFLKNTIRSGMSKDHANRIARWAEVFTPVVVSLLAIPTAVVTGVLAFLWGWTAGLEGEIPFYVRTSLRTVAGVTLFFTVFTPNWRSGQIDADAQTRLSLLPVPRHLLFVGDVLSVLCNPWVLACIPSLLLFPLGMAVGGATSAATIGLLATLLYLLLMAALGTLFVVLLEAVMRNRRLWEWFLLSALGGLIFSCLIPLFWESTGRSLDLGLLLGSWEEGSYPPTAFLIPSECYAAATVRGLSGPGGAFLHIGFLAGVAATTAFVAWKAWSWLNRMGKKSGGGARGRARKAELRRFPFLSPGTSAVAAVHFRAVLRSVRGKIAVLFPVLSMTSSGVAILWGVREDSLAIALAPYLGPALLWLGCLLTVMMLSAIAQNQFASDGPGLRLLFLVPVGMREIVRGKAVAHALLVGMAAIPCIAVAAALSPNGSVWLWLAGLAAFVGSFCLSLPLSVALSAVFPVPADLTKLGRVGNAHPAADLIAIGAASAFFGAPLSIGWRAVLPTVRPVPLFAISLSWAVLGLALLLPLLQLATNFAVSRKESMAAATEGR